MAGESKYETITLHVIATCTRCGWRVKYLAPAQKDRQRIYDHARRRGHEVSMLELKTVRPVG